MTADDYIYLYSQLESSKIPNIIYSKIMNGDNLTNEEEKMIKEIIEKDKAGHTIK